MDITDIRIRRVSADGKLRAYVTVTFEDCFVVHNVKVIEGKNGTYSDGIKQEFEVVDSMLKTNIVNYIDLDKNTKKELAGRKKNNNRMNRSKPVPAAFLRLFLFLITTPKIP